MSEDAKDIIQDVLMKYLSMEKQHIENETGYLIKSVINKSINLKKKRNKVATNSVWLPEPFATENSDDRIKKEEILSYSLLVILEKLTPNERAVFILKQAFDYSHKEIASTIGFSIENSRKLLSRAKSKLADYRTENDMDSSSKATYLENYMKVIKNGDVVALEKLLSKDILLAADGGENIKVVREMTTGIRATSKLLLFVYEAFLTGLRFSVSTINHQPAILFYQKEKLYNCQVFEIHDKEISSIYSIIDPVKLKSLFQ